MGLHDRGEFAAMMPEWLEGGPLLVRDGQPGAMGRAAAPMPHAHLDGPEAQRALVRTLFANVITIAERGVQSITSGSGSYPILDAIEILYELAALRGYSAVTLDLALRDHLVARGGYRHRTTFDVPMAQAVDHDG